MADIPDASVDLIVTSPPYAKRRAHTYGGIDPDDYVEWFLPRAAEFKRVLKPDGSFVLNMKDCVIDGQRHLFLLKLIIALVEEQGWCRVDDYCWHKRNCNPGKWPNRFRDAWEYCFHFTLDPKHFYMDQNAVRQPVGEWAKTRLKSLGKNDVVRCAAATNSGFGKNISNWVGRDLVYPSNVLHLATETSNRKHSAVFPPTLPEFFIKLLSREGGVVCDPFLGSGTTAIVALRNERSFVGAEAAAENIPVIKERLSECGFSAEIIKPHRKRARKRSSEAKVIGLTEKPAIA